MLLSSVHKWSLGPSELCYIKGNLKALSVVLQKKSKISLGFCTFLKPSKLEWSTQFQNILIYTFVILYFNSCRIALFHHLNILGGCCGDFVVAYWNISIFFMIHVLHVLNVAVLYILIAVNLVLAYPHLLCYFILLRGACSFPEKHKVTCMFLYRFSCGWPNSSRDYIFVETLS